MPFIIGVNPVKKKKCKKKKAKKKAKKPTIKRKVTAMAAKKKKPNRKIVYRTKEKIKYRTRNKVVAKRIYRKKDDSLDIKKIVRGSVSVAIGMVIAKAAVNKLSDGGSETDKWSWGNIATAAASGLVASFALGALFKLKRPTVGYIAAGGVALAMYKAFTTKLAPKWGWSESWFGAEDDIHPDFLGAGDEEFDVVDYEGIDDGGYGALETNSGGQVVDYNPNMGAASPAVTDMRQVGNRIASAYPGSY